MNPLSRLLRSLFRDGLPDGFPGRLEGDERVLAVGALADGGHLVVTSWGLWLPDGDRVRRVGWHLVSKATWSGGALVVIEAVPEEVAAGVELLADRPARRLRLVEPGRVPQTVHERVTGSIRSRHHRELPGGGAWFVQRRVPGRDGAVLQVRPDAGADREAVARLAAEVARRLPS